MSGQVTVAWSPTTSHSHEVGAVIVMLVVSFAMVHSVCVLCPPFNGSTKYLSVPCWLVSVKVLCVPSTVPLHQIVFPSTFRRITNLVGLNVTSHSTLIPSAVIVAVHVVTSGSGFVWFIGGVHWVWSDLLLFGFTAAM